MAAPVVVHTVVYWHAFDEAPDEALTRFQGHVQDWLVCTGLTKASTRKENNPHRPAPSRTRTRTKPEHVGNPYDFVTPYKRNLDF